MSQTSPLLSNDLETYRLHQSPISSLSFVSDSHFYSGGQDRALTYSSLSFSKRNPSITPMFSTKKVGSFVSSIFPLPHSANTSRDSSPDCFVSSWDGYVRHFSSITSPSLSKFFASNKGATFCSVSPNSSLLLVGGFDSKIRIFSLNADSSKKDSSSQPEELFTIDKNNRGHESFVNQGIFISDSSFVTCGGDGKLKFFSINLEKKTADLTEFTPSEASSSDLGNLGSSRNSEKTVKESINKVSKTVDGKFVLAASKTFIYVYNVENIENVVLVSVLKPSVEIVDAQFHPTKLGIVGLAGKNKIIVGEIKEGNVFDEQKEIEIKEKTKEIRCIAWNKSGDILVAGCANGGLAALQM